MKWLLNRLGYTKTVYVVSTVGVRATWTCAGCKEVAITRQLAALEPETSSAAAAIALDLPENWVLLDGQTFCSEHQS